MPERLPPVVGLCPVHGEKFYKPGSLDEQRCPEPGCDQMLKLYVPLDVYRMESDVFGRVADAVVAIKAICDEPLDERPGKGPWRTGQFARIEAIVRRVTEGGTDG